MRKGFSCLLASLLCLAFPQATFADDGKEVSPSSASPVQLSPKAQHGIDVLRDMNAPAPGLAETERYARGHGVLGLHARDALEFGYGYNWDNDDSLTRREKHLILIAALIAMERGHELEAHLKFGLVNGVKLEDFEPMLALLTPFVGLPVASNAAGKMHCLMVADADRPAWCPPASGDKE